jgi:ribokinase
MLAHASARDGVVGPIVRLATIGDIAVDVLAGAGESLARGADARGWVRFVPGGSAANVAVWAARLGARVTCIGATGADPWGTWLRDDLRHEGVRVVGPVRGRTAAILAFVDAAGERTFVTDRGAALTLEASDIPTTLRDDMDVLHVPAYSLFEGALADASIGAIRAARSRGVTISIDLSSVSLLRAYGPRRFATLLTDLHPDLLFANLEEAQTVFAVETAAEAAEAMRALASIAIVKQGPQGVLVASRAGTIRAAAPAPAIDATGAGDSLAAAFLVGYRRLGELAPAAWAGVRLAGAVVQAAGARPAVFLPPDPLPQGRGNLALHSLNPQRP